MKVVRNYYLMGKWRVKVWELIKIELLKNKYGKKKYIRKTVQTNMISFVSHGDKTLQRLVGMPGEQEHHISSVPLFFS